MKLYGSGKHVPEEFLFKQSVTFSQSKPTQKVSKLTQTNTPEQGRFLTPWTIAQEVNLFLD